MLEPRPRPTEPDKPKPPAGAEALVRHGSPTAKTSLIKLILPRSIAIMGSPTRKTEQRVPDTTNSETGQHQGSLVISGGLVEPRVHD
jgi:hypothetical protein